MTELCKARGLDVAEGDALQYMQLLADGSLGGLFAGQVVEHLQPDYLMRLLDTAYHKLRAGSRIVLETINPTCWAAFFSSYIRDPTHVRPVHPDTLQYLLNASGFQQVEIRYRAPWPDADKLQRVIVPDTASPELRAAVGTLNANADRLNAKLFSFMDYAAVGIKL
jgi:O-antigen chain-terminating methyltransferase